MDRRQFVLGTAGAFAAPRTLSRLGGGTAVALVTADLEAHVSAVGLTSGRVVRRLGTLEGPRSIESVLGTDAVVAHTAEGAVSLIDGRGLRVRRVLRGFSEPRYTATARNGRHAYVTDSGTGELAVLDVVRGRVVARAEIGAGARHLSLGRSDRRLWISLGTKAERVAIVDVSEPTRPRVLARISPPFLAHDVGFAPDGRIWVSSGDRRLLALYDARGRLLRTFAGDAPPQHVTFLGGRAYVTSGDDGMLRVHALDGTLLRSERVPLGSYNVQEGGGRVLTPSLSQGTLCVADARGRIVTRVHVARSSHDACFVMSA
ncbi:MAG: PQQ-binding-like beta-propeller repeat protein [Actinobacteria bacterium]|nr:PQQ-binding-like beta-propeller repeat protein [Actinomycetota bacterium]